MSIAEFEEKEFEGPLNGQLGLGGPLWSPGQVLEQLVGFDVAMLTVNSVFWAAHGYAAPPPGAVVQPAWWPWPIIRLAVRVRRPPPFRMNVFLQHKRPEYLSRSSASEWTTWNASYFRFWITSHQQVALDACATALGQNGLVAYSCPAFHRRVDLWSHIQNGTLIANTHFAPAPNLSGHRRYTYVNATSPGVAHSEPSKVAPLTVLNGAGGNGDGPPDEPRSGGDGRRPEDLLREARRASQAAITASPGLVGSEALHAEAVRRAEATLAAVGEPVTDDMRDFIFAALFSAMSGIQWLVLAATGPVQRSRR